MSANHKRLLALVLWAQVVLLLAYWKWWPRRLGPGDLHQDERAFILRLPEDGILTRMINQGVMVGLTIPESPKPPATEPPANKQVVAASAKANLPTAPAKAEVLAKKKDTPPEAPARPAVPSASVVEHARVLGRICKAEIQSNTRVAVCYAMIAVPKDRMAALASAADKVSVWVEGK